MKQKRKTKATKAKTSAKKHLRKHETIGVVPKETKKKKMSTKRRGRKEGARPMAVGLRHFVYSIQKGNRWYTGLTPDWQHRLRQHNREIAGGAHKTRPKPKDPVGSRWRVMCLLTAPIEWLDHHCGLQLEWIVNKAPVMMTKQRGRGYEPVTKVSIPGNARATKQFHSLLWMLHNKDKFTVRLAQAVPALSSVDSIESHLHLMYTIAIAEQCPVTFDAKNPLHEIEIFLAPEVWTNATLVTRLRASKFWKPRVALMDLEKETHLLPTPRAKITKA